METFDTQLVQNTNVEVSVAQQQIQASQTPTLIDQVTSLPVCYSLAGLSAALILTAIIREIAYIVSSRRKSKKISNLELLEKIWKMDASKYRK